MKYTDLDLDRQREFLVNLRVNLLTTALLAEVTDNDEICAKLWQMAYDLIATLPASEIERTIALLEKQRRPFNQPGMPLALELFNIQDDH